MREFPAKLSKRSDATLVISGKVREDFKLEDSGKRSRIAVRVERQKVSGLGFQSGCNNHQIEGSDANSWGESIGQFLCLNGQLFPRMLRQKELLPNVRLKLSPLGAVGA